jgi:hypothetical protein
MTADVTHLPLQVDHYDSCDRDVYGRAVMHMLSTGAANDITAANLRSYARGWRDVAKCDCIGLRIKAAETAAVTANKRFEFLLVGCQCCRCDGGAG